MGNDWQSATVEEIAVKVGMGPFGSSIKVETFVDEGIPIISGQHLTGVRLIDIENNFISYEHAERLKNANVYKGDVIFTHAGNIGQVAYIPDTSKYERYIISQRQFYMRCNQEKILPEFITYFFNSPEGRHKLLSNVSSSGVPSIAQPVSYLKTIRVPVPSLSEQRAIAHILGALDDKIELNHKMNQTLEAMAQAVFKSWFVDFEPVHAKAEGRDTGLPFRIADLFPDSFVDSEIGSIPTGWRVGKLSELCTTQYGYTASANGEPVGPHLLRVTDINKASWIEWDTVPYCNISEENFQKYELNIGDIVVARMADPGKSAIIEQSVKAVFASYLVRLKTHNLAYAYFIYRFLKSQAYLDYVESVVGDSSVQKSMNAKVMVNVELVVPDKLIIEELLSRIQYLRKLMIMNIEQSSCLKKIRDTLLPKLLSGEIRIKDAEKFLERGINA